MLVIKQHPLDDGLISWRRLVARLAAKSGLSGRVIYLEVGDLNDLIARTRGVVTVNSTSGTAWPLAIGAPVVVLGTAIYDIVGADASGRAGQLLDGCGAAGPGAVRRVPPGDRIALHAGGRLLQ